MNLVDMISKLPVWILGIAFSALFLVFLYAVLSGRSVDLWGFKIGGKEKSPVQPNIDSLIAKSPSQPVVEPPSFIQRESPPAKPSKKIFKRDTVTLKLGEMCKLPAPISTTIILRGIEVKPHKTIYSHKDGEFALIEFKDRCICPTEGTYQEGLYKIWLPYFTTGELDYHSAFSVELGYKETQGSATFYWIEHINSHSNEITLNFMHLSGEA